MHSWGRLFESGARSNILDQIDSSISFAFDLQSSIPSPKLLKRMNPVSPWAASPHSIAVAPSAPSSSPAMRGEVAAWERVRASPIASHDPHHIIKPMQTAERLRSRTMDAANQAAALKTKAWQKDSQSTWASARAAELEAEAAGCRIRGDLGGALRTIKEANRLHDDSDAAAEEAEALRYEARQKEAEADDASRRAIDAISRSALLGAANANRDAIEAEERALASRQSYSELLKQLGIAMKKLEEARAWQVEAAERLRDTQMQMLASRLGGERDGDSSRLMGKDDAEEEEQRRADVQKASALVASLETHLQELSDKVHEAEEKASLDESAAEGGGAGGSSSILSHLPSLTSPVGNELESALIERFENLSRSSIEAAQAADAARHDLQSQADYMRSKAAGFRSNALIFESEGKFEEADAALATAERLETSCDALASNSEDAEREMKKQRSVHQHVSNVLKVLRGDETLSSDHLSIEEEALGAVLADDVLAAYSLSSLSALQNMKQRVDSLLKDFPHNQEIDSLSPDLLASLSSAASFIQMWKTRTEGDSDVRQLHALHHIQQLASRMSDLKQSVLSVSDQRGRDPSAVPLNLSSQDQVLTTPLVNHQASQPLSLPRVKPLTPRAIQYEPAEQKDESKKDEAAPSENLSPQISEQEIQQQAQVYLTNQNQADEDTKSSPSLSTSIASSVLPRSQARADVMAIIAREPMREKVLGDINQPPFLPTNLPSTLFRTITALQHHEPEHQRNLVPTTPKRQEVTEMDGPSDGEISAVDPKFASLLQRRDNLAQTLNSLSAFITDLDGECKALSHEETHSLSAASIDEKPQLLLEKELAAQQSDLLSAQLDAIMIAIDHQRRRHWSLNSLSHLQRLSQALASLSSNALRDAVRFELQAEEEGGMKSKIADDLALRYSSSRVNKTLAMSLVQSSELLLLSSSLRANAVKMSSKASEARKRHLELNDEADVIKGRVAELMREADQHERLSLSFSQEADAWAGASLLHGLKGGLRLRGLDGGESHALALFDSLIGDEMGHVAQEVIQLDHERKIDGDSTLAPRISLAVKAALELRVRRERLAEGIVQCNVESTDAWSQAYELSSASFESARLSFSAMNKSLEMRSEGLDDLSSLYKSLSDLFYESYLLHEAMLSNAGMSKGADGATQEVAVLLQESIRHLMSALQLSERGIESDVTDSSPFKVYQLFQEALDKQKVSQSFKEDALRARQEAKREAAFCASSRDSEDEACSLARLHQSVLLRVAPDLEELADLLASESRLLAKAAGLFSSFEGTESFRSQTEVDDFIGQASDAASKVIRLKESSAPRARAASALNEARELQRQAQDDPTLSWAAQVSAHRAMSLVAYSNISKHLSAGRESVDQGSITRAQCMGALFMVDAQLAALSIEISQSVSAVEGEIESSNTALDISKMKLRRSQEALIKARSSIESCFSSSSSAATAKEACEVMCEGERIKTEIDRLSLSVSTAEQLCMDARDSQAAVRQCFQLSKDLASLIESAREKFIVSDGAQSHDLPSSAVELIAVFCSHVDSALDAMQSCSVLSSDALRYLKVSSELSRIVKEEKDEASAFGFLASTASEHHSSLLSAAEQDHISKHKEALQRLEQSSMSASRSKIDATVKSREAEEAKDQASRTLDRIAASFSQHQSLRSIFKAPLPSIDKCHLSSVQVMQTPGPSKGRIELHPAPPPPPPPPPPAPPPPASAQQGTIDRLSYLLGGSLDVQKKSDLSFLSPGKAAPDNRPAPLPGNLTPWQISVLFRLWRQKLSIMTGMRDYERSEQGGTGEAGEKRVVQALAMVERLAMLGGAESGPLPLPSPHLHGSNTEACASITLSLSGLPTATSPSTVGGGSIIAKHIKAIKSIQDEMKMLVEGSQQRGREARNEAGSLQRLAGNCLRLCDQLRDNRASQSSISALNQSSSLSISALKAQRISDQAREAFEQRAEMNAEAQSCDEEYAGIQYLVGQSDRIVTLFGSAARCEGDAFQAQLEAVECAITIVLALSSTPPLTTTEGIEHWTRVDALAQQSLAKYSEASSLIQKAMREGRRLGSSMREKLSAFATALDDRAKKATSYSLIKAEEAAVARAKANRADSKSRSMSHLKDLSTVTALEDAAKRWSDLADSFDSASASANKRSLSLHDAAEEIRRLVDVASDSLIVLHSNRAAVAETGRSLRGPIEAYAETSALQLLSSTRLLAQASFLATKTAHLVSQPFVLRQLQTNAILDWRDDSMPDDALRMISSKIDQAESKVRSLRGSMVMEAVKGSSILFADDIRKETTMDFETLMPSAKVNRALHLPPLSPTTNNNYIPLTIRAAGRTALSQLSPY